MSLAVVIRIIGFLLFIVILFLLFFYFFQRSLMYFPARVTPAQDKFGAQDMQLISLHTVDQLTLNSWYIKAKPGQPTVLYLHGNAGHIGFRMPLVRQFISAGFGVLLLEYRGYGGNPGAPTEEGLYSDARAALHYLQNTGLKTEGLVLYGESLGTAVATKLASENKVCAVVLQSPYTSMSRLATYHYPWIWIKPRDKFDSLSRINKNSAPLLILHGKKDVVVPFSEGLELFIAAPEPKKMLSYEGKTHNNLWSAPGFAESVIGFIKENCRMGALE